MDKQYDLYLVLGSLLISFLTSFLAIAFASFIVWHKKNSSKWWLFGAAVNMGLGIWAMHFVGMLALHIDTPVAFEPVRTVLSAFIAVVASYLAFWSLLSADFKSHSQRLFYGTLVLGSGVASMHYLGMDAMQMFPNITYDMTLFMLSLVIAYSASYVGLRLFVRSASQIHHLLFSRANLMSALVIGFAVTGMHYTGMAAAEFDINSYCTVLEEGIRFGSLAVMTIGSILVLLLMSFVLITYEQHIDAKEHEQNRVLLKKVTEEVDKRTAELQKQTEMNERLLETMDAIVVVLSHEGKVLQFNLAAQLATGYSAEELKGRYVWDYLIPEDQVEDIMYVFAELAAGMFPNKHQNEWVTKTGGRIMIDWHNSALVDDSGKVTHVIGTGIDITQTLKDQEALKLSAIAFETQEALVVTDSKGIILKVNQAFEEITGYTLQEVLGRDMRVLKSGRHPTDFYQKMWASIQEKGYWQGEIWNKRKNGEIFPEWLRITRVLGNNDQVINYIGNFSDISQRKQIEQELEKLAFYDAVTQLPNRRLFTDRLQQSVNSCVVNKTLLGVVFIDLDNFKQINDTFGHSFGDRLLQVFSQHVKKLIPHDATIARFGGDEFIVLLSGLPGNHTKAAFQCEHLAQTILESLSDEIHIDGHHVYLTSSIGITVSDCKEDDVQSLLMQADTAMYQAKAMGKNTFRFYTQAIGEAQSERFKIEAEMRKLLNAGSSENEEMFVVYQPQYDAGQQIIGAEALIRWESEVLGFVSPVKFIPVAEDSGLIDELGMFVVERVLDDLNRMGSLFESSSLQHISINLSIKQLTNPNLAERLLDIFQQRKIEPDKVRFEFTESAFLDNALDPQTLFTEMSSMGFTFALDDFGTGFSSLAYLKELPITELKIDKSFIDGIPQDESDMTICSATIDMAQRLGLEVVAEGVESQDQFNWLVSQNCDLLQGYFMSKPVVYDELVKLLDA